MYNIYTAAEIIHETVTNIKTTNTRGSHPRYLTYCGITLFSEKGIASTDLSNMY